jgi:predicted NUDIX family NTP pyrophosphohydrolase
MNKISAGILVYRFSKKQDLEVLLVHPGGPIWGARDWWTIPKGELDEDEVPLEAAKREFREEVGLPVPNGKLLDLGSYGQSSSKTNYIWAIKGEIDSNKMTSNEFTLEWPKGSGRIQSYPECDRAEWFGVLLAKNKVFKSQIEFINRLEQAILAKSC